MMGRLSHLGLNFTISTTEKYNSTPLSLSLLPSRILNKKKLLYASDCCLPVPLKLPATTAGLPVMWTSAHQRD